MINLEEDIQRCLGVLANGGSILYPTDTVWGIGCDATNEDAVRKIFTLKKRPDEKAMIILVADERDILQHVAAPDPQIFDYIDAIEKPVTVIYDNAIGLADNLIAPDGSIAIRICRDNFCRQLLKRFRKPLVSTSANRSGEPAPADFSAITQDIINGVDYVVQHRQSEVSSANPSMIIRWQGGKPVVFRP